MTDPTAKAAKAETFAEALVAALSELTVVEKGNTATIPGKNGKQGYSYSYADLADVVKLVTPVLSKHGLAAMTPVHAHEGGLACTVILLHTSGERWESEPFPFPRGNDAQATGSAVTYHRRYALVAALGMAAGDDDDGAAATADAHKVKPVDPRVSSANAESLIAKCESLGLVVAEVVKLGTDGRTDDPYEVHKDEVSAVKAAMDNLAPAEGQEPVVEDG